MGKRGAGHIKDTEYVGLELGAHLLLWEFFEGAAQSVARVVHDHIEAAELRGRLLDDGVNPLAVGHVQFEDACPLGMCAGEVVYR
jgi:hypothetical protein